MSLACELHRLSYLYPAETSLYLQLLHQFPSLADTHGAVHWGVSFHAKHKQPHFTDSMNTALPLDSMSETIIIIMFQ